VLIQPLQDIQEEELFAAALALPESERIAYLERACSSDRILIDRLTRLIDAFGSAASFIHEAGSCAWDDVGRIGQYRLLRELGEGGCGIAYHAEQSAPVKRQVALKVIKPGMDTRAVIARFEAERQALALMEHPNVARVFDAGTTNEGRPYFVMELIRGIRITDYCAQSRLTLPERLSLFVQVCQAIQHAHQKGIIHRDIKPSNVLVTMHDGLPVAKVIDFGIAKATQSRLIDQTLHTEVDQIMGTPAYISPEQAEPAQVTVDTRSDIYSLGVLLYELLTGQTPLDAHELAQASIERLRERIRSEQPPRPSRRLSSLADQALSGTSRESRAFAAMLAREVRDDMDWIAMKCLEKEPARRYQAVNELISDIDRYLRNESVLARPPSFVYGLRKLAQRNRVVFASALTFVLFTVAFAAAMTIQAQRIALERDQAEQEREAAQRASNVAMNLLAIADPFENLAHGVNGSALLKQAAESIDRELRDQPVARARLLNALGRAHLRRGEFGPAIVLLEETRKILSHTPGSQTDALAAMTYLSMAVRNSGDLHRARQVLVDAEGFAKLHGLQRSAGYAKLLLNRARLNAFESRIPAAVADLEKSLQLYKGVVGDHRVDVAEVLTELALTLTWTDDLAHAEQTARAALDIYSVTTPPMYPDRITTEVILADTLYLQDRLDESAAILVDALRKNTEVFGTNSENVIGVLDRLAMIRYAQGRLHEAEAASEDALTRARSVFGERHWVTAGVAITLARTLIELRNFGKAETTFREALDVLAKGLPADHQQIASAEYFLGELLLATNRPREAEAVLTASMNRWKRGDAPPWRAMRSASALGEALYRQGRIAEAEKYISESFHELSSDPKADREAKDKARARAERYVRTTLASQ
jgi:serine/threonine protein kinase